MNIVIKRKNVQLRPEVEAYLEKKIKRLEKHFANINEIVALFSQYKTVFHVEITLTGDGVVLRGEEKNSASFESAIDTVVDKLDKQVLKFKGKKYGQKKYLGPKLKDVEKEKALIEYTKIEDDTPGVMKMKNFAMKPMSVDEAIENMELTYHTFFFFLNEETEKYSVVYKRDDNNYGLIEPT